VVDDEMIERLRAATELLESVAVDRSPLDALSDEERHRFLNAAGDVFCPDVEERRQRAKARRRRAKAEKLRREEEVLDQTGIRSLRSRPVFLTPNVFPPEPDSTGPALSDPALQESSPPAPGSGPTVDGRHCYVCKADYSLVHRFYDQLCPPCAELNERKRTETADLRGRVALLTGGRVKIGYQAGIKLLRAGAELIVTTRFPRDAAVRYAAEPDFEEWGHRLEIFGLDLRHTPSVEALCHHMATTRDRLDFIVNNACQTVRRPPDFYRHMMALETASASAMPEHVRALLGGIDGARRRPAVRTGRAPGVHRPRPLGHPAGAGHLGRAVAGRSCSPRNERTPATCSRTGGSTRTSSRWTCAAGTRGASRSPRSRRWSCSRPSWSTRWRRSCSTPASSRSCSGARSATSTS
jgi:hypothetical protein